MTRFRTLWIVAPIAVGMTAAMMVGVNAFVPWLMRTLIANPKLTAVLSNLSWAIPVCVAIFIPITYGRHRRRNPRPDPSARLTVRRPSIPR
jgi:hypothetical protein